MKRNEHIAAVVRALGGQDPEMPVVSKEQTQKDLKELEKFCEKLTNAVEVLKKEANITS